MPSMMERVLCTTSRMRAVLSKGPAKLNACFGCAFAKGTEFYEGPSASNPFTEAPSREVE